MLTSLLIDAVADLRHVFFQRSLLTRVTRQSGAVSRRTFLTTAARRGT